MAERTASLSEVEDIKKEEEEEKEVDAVSKREVLFGYIRSRMSETFLMKKWSWWLGKGNHLNVSATK